MCGLICPWTVSFWRCCWQVPEQEYLGVPVCRCVGQTLTLLFLDFTDRSSNCGGRAPAERGGGIFTVLEGSCSCLRWNMCVCVCCAVGLFNWELRRALYRQQPSMKHLEVEASIPQIEHSVSHEHRLREYPSIAKLSAGCRQFQAKVELVLHVFNFLPVALHTVPCVCYGDIVGFRSTDRRPVLEPIIPSLGSEKTPLIQTPLTSAGASIITNRNPPSKSCACWPLLSGSSGPLG